MMIEPRYLQFARSYIGLSEVPGIRHNPTIVKWWQSLGAWFRDDETPWCGAFVARCMQEAGNPFPKNFFRAREWATYGSPLKEPKYGCIVVFSRDGGGHVAFCVGRDRNGNLLCLGGNQRNQVNIAPFATARVIAYRQPPGYVLEDDLPLIAASGPLSTNEA